MLFVLGSRSPPAGVDVNVCGRNQRNMGGRIGCEEMRRSRRQRETRLTLISCLLFLMRSRSALISSSMLSLMRLASASRCSLVTRSCSVSDAGGLRKSEKGSASVLELWTEGGLEVEIMAGVGGTGYRREARVRGGGRRGRGKESEEKRRWIYRVHGRRALMLQGSERLLRPIPCPPPRTHSSLPGHRTPDACQNLPDPGPAAGRCDATRPCLSFTPTTPRTSRGSK